MSLNELLYKLDNSPTEDNTFVEKNEEKIAEAIDSDKENTYNKDIKNETQSHLNEDEEILEKIAQAKDLGIIMARELHKELTRLLNQ